MSTNTDAVAAAFLLLVGVLVGPLATLWALNQLFGLELAYTFPHWLAIAWLHAAIAIRRSKENT